MTLLIHPRKLLKRQKTVVNGKALVNVFWASCRQYFPIRTSDGRTTRQAGKVREAAYTTSRKDSQVTLLELRSEFFHCCIFSGNFTRLSTVQSYLCSD